MNQNDARDRQIRDHVRGRMGADAPPEFTGNVMTEIHRSPQRRRGLAWPIATGLVTVAAAAAVVAIGLGLLDGKTDVGVGPSPSASASASPSGSETASPSASASPPVSSSPSAEPTIQDGEFGPIHSMAPDEAFPDPQTCEVAGAITTNGETSEVGYTIAYPAGWYTNEEGASRSACTLFAPQPFELREDGMVPEQVAIEANLPPGGDYGAGGTVVSTEEYTVDGVAAIRLEISPEDGGFVREYTVAWVIAVAGALPAEGNDRPYLVLSASSPDEAEATEWAEVLDRMVATLDIGSAR